jgi:hypothetical protein
VGASTSHNPIGLLGLLQGQLYVFYGMAVGSRSLSAVLKPAIVAFAPPQIPHDLTRDATSRSCGKWVTDRLN